MSKKVQMLIIEPSEYGINTEEKKFSGFTCPRCNGRGGRSEEVSRNNYVLFPCEMCWGIGKVSANTFIHWNPVLSIKKLDNEEDEPFAWEIECQEFEFSSFISFIESTIESIDSKLMLEQITPHRIIISSEYTFPEKYMQHAISQLMIELKAKRDGHL